MLEFNARESRIDEVNWDDEYSVILVGGVGLERGYTVKGLTVSYISRSAGGKQKDTLLQRARFFGYHENYKDFIQIYLPESMQMHYQTISESNKNLFKSIKKFKKEKPKSNFKDWVPEYIATNMSDINLTRKGIQRRNKIVNYRSNYPIINKCNHLLSHDELIINQEIYKIFLDLTKDSLIHLKDFEDLKPEYKEWASKRSIYISTAMNMKNLYELIKQLKFHNSEWKEFLVSKTNFDLHANNENKEINSRICPVFFMNHNTSSNKEKERTNLPNSFKINPHSGKNSNYNKNDKSTYDFFPGDRMVHFDFVTGTISPDTDQNIGKMYTSVQIYNFDKVNYKGEMKSNVPYFNIYPASDLWVDITKVE